MRLVIIPGIGGSDERHWQSRWEAASDDAVRIVPSSWDRPDLEDWMAAVDMVAPTAEDVIVAHSMGCLAAAEWLRRHPAGVAAVLMVAAPDPTAPAYPAEAAGFGALPVEALGVPATLIASEDDPYASPPASEEFARRWRAELVAVGKLGHINSASDLGDWPQGRGVLDALIRRALA